MQKLSVCDLEQPVAVSGVGQSTIVVPVVVVVVVTLAVLP